jgi:septum formation protein
LPLKQVDKSRFFKNPLFCKRIPYMIHRVFHRLVLASQSSARAALLKALGVKFESIPAHLDEGLIKKRCQQQGRSAVEAALELAIAKAQTVAQSLPTGTLVIGADQILSCEGRWFDKAVSLAQAQEHLSFLQGKNHLLASATCVVHQGTVVWQYVAVPQLTMRSMNADEIADYLRKSGEDVLSSVGCYKLELTQGNVFSHIEGDRNTIMGLPLKELAQFLESQGISCNLPQGSLVQGLWDSALSFLPQS